MADAQPIAVARISSEVVRAVDNISALLQALQALHQNNDIEARLAAMALALIPQVKDFIAARDVRRTP
ncbi:MAG: hypothetical protein ABI601_18590 [bacterium]